MEKCPEIIMRRAEAEDQYVATVTSIVDLFPFPMSNLIGPFVILILAASSYYLAPLSGQCGQNTAWRERVPERETARMKRYRIS